MKTLSYEVKKFATDKKLEIENLKVKKSNTSSDRKSKTYKESIKTYKKETKESLLFRFKTIYFMLLIFNAKLGFIINMSCVRNPFYQIC